VLLKENHICGEMMMILMMIYTSNKRTPTPTPTPTTTTSNMNHKRFMTGMISPTIRYFVIKLVIIICVQVALTNCIVGIVASPDFDPYIMNGGLIAAVAGRDYIVLATDTRLIGPSGYDILDRYHIGTRLWSATSIVPNGDGGGIDTTTDGTSTGSLSPQDRSNEERKDVSHVNNGNLLAPDGSLNIQLYDELHHTSLQGKGGTTKLSQTEKTTSSTVRLLRDIVHSNISPTIIGSVGCQVDCDQLKRTVRADVRTAVYFGEIASTMSTRSGITDVEISIDSIVVLLSQILYSRRGFPYGCYCLLGGLSFEYGGQVYGYDAIGSYEQLAVCCTGTGFELLQPILDRQFTSYIGSGGDNRKNTASSDGSHPMMQPRRPTPTQVACPTVEEAINVIIDAYRSVSEREIGVGDHVVLYSIQKHKQVSNDNTIVNNSDNDRIPPMHESQRVLYRSRIWTAPLKKH
jgi:20S proteasome alpha/beta subunit